MSMKRLLVALAVAGAAFGIAGAVQASIPDSGGVAHGCYYTPPKLSRTQQLPGDLRLIDADKSQHCNTDESPVDLATPAYVQNVVTTTVNQTVVTGSDTFNGPFVAGDHWVQWTCGGWVAINPTVSVAGTVSDVTSTQAPITLHAVMNVESQNAGTTNAPFGTTTRIYYSLSSPQTIHTQVQCVDPRVFGETFPVAAPAAKPTVTAG